MSFIPKPHPCQNIITSLTDDLQLQILKRLPLISLLRSRTVSKSSQATVSSPNTSNSTNPSLYIRYYDRTNKTEQYLTAEDETFGLHFLNNIIPFQYASKTAYFRVVGYCQGVVCFSDDLFDSMHMVVLWNPSIRKSLRLLVPDCEQTWLGFGVCPVTHDPKVVRIVYVIAMEDPPLVEVFSLASRAWRKPCNRLRNTIQVTWSQVCFNGAIHWVAYEKRIDTTPRCLIVSFELVHEVFDEMSLPDGLAQQHVSNLSISTRKGQLTVIEYDMEKGKEGCGVWVMKEYGVMGSWEKLYVIQLPGLLRRVVGFRMNGDMILALKNHELVFVDCAGNVKSLGIYGNIRSFFVGSYMESLILTNQLDQ
ncbi:F-box protein At3g07870-like [Bidens hawaiensis]|uniref:F-box protein At3g07870-like n=1 Tax=Bidens hawaiensis TaxID=980011 RepID=UPI00404A7962